MPLIDVLASPLAPFAFADVVGAHRYRLGALLGEGATGSVYEAVCIETGQSVAVKLLREDARQAGNERSRLRARFERETRLCERLHHPHIVALLDKGEAPDGRLFAVFERVPGRTLRDVLRTDGALPAVTAGQLMAQVLEGLASAHRRGVVHRDLKPQNVMVTIAGSEPRAKILDFGIGALLPHARSADEPTLTEMAEVLGTPQYCSPEQLRREAPNARSDLYSWGLLVIECLTGSPVMQGASVADILYQQLSPVDVALPPAIAVHPLGTLLRLALNKDPSQRAGSAQALLEGFREIHFPTLMVGMNCFPALRAPPPARTLSARIASKDERAVAVAGGAARQVTTLCCSVTVVVDGGEADAKCRDALDMYEAQCLSKCVDTAVRYGGQLAGTLGDTLLFYFCHGEGTGRAARRAVRAALDIVYSVGRACQAPPEEAKVTADVGGWRVEIAAAIHVGTMLLQKAALPVGAISGEAVRLQRLASPGQILLSDDARRSLERYVNHSRTPLRFAARGAVTRPVYVLLGERHTFR